MEGFISNNNNNNVENVLRNLLGLMPGQTLDQKLGLQPGQTLDEKLGLRRGQTLDQKIDQTIDSILHRRLGLKPGQTLDQKLDEKLHQKLGFGFLDIDEKPPDEKLKLHHSMPGGLSLDQNLLDEKIGVDRRWSLDEVLDEKLGLYPGKATAAPLLANHQSSLVITPPPPANGNTTRTNHQHRRRPPPRRVYPKKEMLRIRALPICQPRPADLPEEPIVKGATPHKPKKKKKSGGGKGSGGGGGSSTRVSRSSAPGSPPPVDGSWRSPSRASGLGKVVIPANGPLTPLHR